MRYGRLIMDTEIYPCLKRACVTLDAIRKSRIGQLQIRGTEHKEHMKAYDAETAEGKADLIYGRIEHLLDTAAKIAGLTQGQYREWRTVERLETGPKSGRGRSLSNRRKRRHVQQEEADRETSAARRDRQKKRTKKKEKRNAGQARTREKGKGGKDQEKKKRWEDWEEAATRAKGERDVKAKAQEQKRAEEREEKRAEEQKEKERTLNAQDKAEQEAEEWRRNNPIRTAISKGGDDRGKGDKKGPPLMKKQPMNFIENSIAKGETEKKTGGHLAKEKRDSRQNARRMGRNSIKRTTTRRRKD